MWPEIWFQVKKKGSVHSKVKSFLKKIDSNVLLKHRYTKCKAKFGKQGVIRYSFCCIIRLFFFKSDIKFVRKKGLGSPDFMAHWISFAERIGMPFVKTIKNYWVLFERYSLTRYRKTTKQPHVHILGLGWGPQLGILLENILILRILKIY